MRFCEAITGNFTPPTELAMHEAKMTGITPLQPSLFLNTFAFTLAVKRLHGSAVRTRQRARVRPILLSFTLSVHNCRDKTNTAKAQELLGVS